MMNQFNAVLTKLTSLLDMGVTVDWSKAHPVSHSMVPGAPSQGLSSQNMKLPLPSVLCKSSEYVQRLSLTFIVDPIKYNGHEDSGL
jgi:hypothetical protein